MTLKQLGPRDGLRDFRVNPKRQSLSPSQRKHLHEERRPRMQKRPNQRRRRKTQSQKPRRKLQRRTERPKLMKTTERQEVTTKKLNNVNIISPELPYLFSCTIQRNIFIDYFLKKKKRFRFSSSKIRSSFYRRCSREKPQKRDSIFSHSSFS